MGQKIEYAKKKKGLVWIIFELALKRATRANNWYLHLADNPKPCTASQDLHMKHLGKLDLIHLILNNACFKLS